MRIFSIFIILVMIFLQYECCRADENPRDFLVVVSEDYSPFSYFDVQSKEVRGVTIDVLKEVFKNIPNLRLKIVSYPWPRAQQMVKIGHADAMLTYPSLDRLTYSEKAEHFAYQTYFKVFTFKDNPQQPDLEQRHSLEQLQDISFCEYSGSGWAKDNIAGKFKNISYSSSFETKIKMLVAKRCQIIIENEVVVLYQSRRMGVADQIKELSAPGWPTPFYLMISKKSQHLAKMKVINEAFKSANKGKLVSNIVNKWAREN